MRIKLTTSLVSFALMSSLSFGESPKQARVKSIVDKTKSIKENVKSCESLISTHCKELPSDQCMQQADPKSAQVAMCVSYMMNHKGDINSNNLKPSFKTLYNKVTNQSDDFKKCVDTAKAICGDGSNFEACYNLRPGSFPSYCKTAVQDNLQYMEAAYKNDKKLGMCTDLLMNKCKLDVTDTTESDAQVTRKLANYQSCVKSMIPKMRECQQLIKPDGNGAPAATNSVQLIGQ